MPGPACESRLRPSDSGARPSSPRTGVSGYAPAMSAAPFADIDLDALPAPVRAAFLAERAARERLEA